VKYLHAENYKPLVKELEKDLNKYLLSTFMQAFEREFCVCAETAHGPFYQAQYQISKVIH